MLYDLSSAAGTPKRELGHSLKFGCWYGLAAGFGVGFGTYSTMPIPLEMAWGWFLGSVAEAVAGAVVLHFVFRARLS